MEKACAPTGESSAGHRMRVWLPVMLYMALIFYFSSLMLSTATVILGGIPAAIYERYVGANDLAAVVHTGGVSNGNQDFTNNQRLLLQAVDKFMGRKLRSSTLNKIDDYQRRVGTQLQSDPARDLEDKERGFQARAALDTIRNLANYLGNIRGRRKAIVMFSEGIDYNIYDIMSINNTGATEIEVFAVP